MSRSRHSIFRVIAPGLLIAATGVGAGDLATAGLAGVNLGCAVLWAVVLGAVFKFVINEGLARWQLATGETLLEGAMRRYGRIARVIFFPYLLAWSFLVGSAILGASGVALHAIIPIFDDPSRGKIVFGALQSVLGMLLVWRGGYALFERFMGICVAVMFVTVVVTAILLQPDFPLLFDGLFKFQIPEGGTRWTVALMGGVGGTLTILCYGYWIREHQRSGEADLWVCRIDLLVGYFITAFFGLALIVIASRVDLAAGGRGVDLIVQLGTSLESQLGGAARWAFLGGAWCAIFSSLLGVWQSVPYMFADFLRSARSTNTPISASDREIDTRGAPYRGYLLALTFVPLLGLFFPFAAVQKVTGIVGALSIPLIGTAVLLLNSRRELGTLRSHPVTQGVLVGILIFFVWILLRTLGITS